MATDESCKVDMKNKPAEIVARCDRCGRDYIYVNPALTEPPKCMDYRCEGRVRMLEEATHAH